MLYWPSFYCLLQKTANPKKITKDIMRGTLLSTFVQVKISYGLHPGKSLCTAA